MDGTAVRIDPSPAPQGQPSFTLIQTWKATRGTHTISVRAYNAAGAVSDPVAIMISVAPAIAQTGSPTPPSVVTQAPPTATNTPQSPSACADNSAFVTDVTVPDGTTMTAGQPLNKIWRLSNNGTCAWGAGYQFVFVSGEAMATTTIIAVPNTAPGATADLLVAMTAPTTPGAHSGVWQLRNPSSALFGTKATVKINVASAPPPPGTLTIQTFTADAQNIATGKRLTFVVQTTGATSARTSSSANSSCR